MPIAHCRVAFWVALALVALSAPCGAETLDLVPSPASNYRWRDVATYVYSPAYQATYLYDSAGVTVDFDRCRDSVFAGHLTATDLKPNFAYQIKLVGKPEGIWGSAGDDTTNERIGYAGRWWRVTPNPGNSNDADYEAHRDDPDYIYEGYLVFDFFTTDRFGAAELDFASTSSYHVLWWEDQRTRGSCDSPVEWSTVTGFASDPAYDEDVGPTEVGVYAEIERLCYGETTLPGGHYNCRFALTEESFHQSGPGEGGWATVLVCDTLTFEIDCAAGVPGVPRDRLLREYCLGPNPFGDRVSLEFTVPAAGRAEMVIYDMRGRLIRRCGAELPGAGARVLSWDGTDSAGRQVAEGIYFYHLKSGDAPDATGKLVLLR